MSERRCRHTAVEVWVLGRTDDVHTVQRRTHEAVVTELRNEFSDQPHGGYRVSCLACEAEWKGKSAEPATAPRWVSEALAAYRDDAGAYLL